MIHKLKTWPEYFEPILMGHKTFEVRLNDRNYNVGDQLILQEWDIEEMRYTGRSLARTVSYIMKGGLFGIDEAAIIMSIQ